jgi:hypothetical protein
LEEEGGRDLWDFSLCLAFFLFLLCFYLSSHLVLLKSSIPLTNDALGLRKLARSLLNTHDSVGRRDSWWRAPSGM